MGAALDFLARNRRANPVIVVRNFERAEAGLAHMQRIDRIFLAAFAALEISDVAHLFPRSLHRVKPGGIIRTWELLAALCMRPSAIVMADKFCGVAATFRAR